MLGCSCCSRLLHLCPPGFASRQRVSISPYGRVSPRRPPPIPNRLLPQPDAKVLLEAFLSDPAEAVVGFGLDGAIFLWNQAAQELYGFTQTEIVGKPAACLLPLYELSAHDNLLKNPSWNEPLLEAVAERINRTGPTHFGPDSALADPRRPGPNYWRSRARPCSDAWRFLLGRGSAPRSPG
jgi:PAS domain S-box-containing protein